MHEHDRLSAIDLLEDGRECRLAQQLAGITRQDTDAVELEHIERVFDLFQAAVGVRQWDGGEHPEAAGKSRIIWAPNSLHTRARERAVSPSSNHTPGLVI